MRSQHLIFRIAPYDDITETASNLRILTLESSNVERSIGYLTGLLYSSAVSTDVDDESGGQRFRGDRGVGYQSNQSPFEEPQNSRTVALLAAEVAQQLREGDEGIGLIFQKEMEEVAADMFLKAWLVSRFTLSLPRVISNHGTLD